MSGHSKRVFPLRSVGAKKKYGYGVGYGEIAFGYSLFGDDDLEAGVYKHVKLPHKKFFGRMRHYWPTDPGDSVVLANRQKFATAVSEWASLTFEQQEVYNKRGKRLGIPGRNLFIKEYMLGN